MNIEQLIEMHEGFVPHAYQDSEGYLTIGIGCLIDKRRGGGITHEEAVYLLRNRLEKLKRELYEKIPWYKHLSHVRQMAIVDMAYNMGVPTLMAFNNMMVSMKVGDYKSAAAHAKDSRWYKQVKTRGDRIVHMIEFDELPRF